MLTAIIGTLLIAAGVTIYACLRVSGECSEWEEKWINERKRKAINTVMMIVICALKKVIVH